MYRTDNRIVMTLDAGGTNFVFSAIQSNEEIVEPITLPAYTDNLEKCLNTLSEGFAQIKTLLEKEPVAISFAFPGPADYKNGIIGDLPNFKSFRNGVALGAFLEEKFQIPVYINNDGNLFAYGEALCGILPSVNNKLKETDPTRQYKNLLGLTLGTGFGAGAVINDIMLDGDNGCGGDVWNFRNKYNPELIVEEHVSIRAVKRIYSELSGNNETELSPKDIFNIAEGNKDGDKEAARASFAKLGEAAGDAISYALNIVDGIVAIGGGLAGAAKYILPSLISELERKISMLDGSVFPRMQMKFYNLADATQYNDFFAPEDNYVQIPFSDTKVKYNTQKRTAIVISDLGTSKAISLGAYAYALSQLDKAECCC